MTIEEKLRIMEEIRDDLREDESKIPVPGWHFEVLRDREHKVAEGQAEFVDLDTFKKLVAEDIARGRPK